MLGIVTGDIVGSRRLKNQAAWLDPLKKIFNGYGRSPKSWEIFRGDSFQLAIRKPEEAYYVAVRIKAEVKCIKGLDVRLAIGLGAKDYDARKISESNGQVFVNSGEMYDLLKARKRDLGMRSPWKTFDREMNLYLRLISVVMERWSPNVAEYVKIALEHPEMNQQTIGEILGILQPSVSERNKRAYLDEVIDVDKMYRDKLLIQLQSNT